MNLSQVGALLILSCSLLVAQVTPAKTEATKPGKVYHIGGNVKPPRAISSPQPAFDESQEKLREANAGKKVVNGGSVLLLIVVGGDGSVRSIKVLQSLNRDLDAKATDAVKSWKFEPGTKKGVPVAVEMGVQVDFHFYN